jgi:hypothetical protein
MKSTRDELLSDITRLTGEPGTRYRARYADGKSGLSGLAENIEHLFVKADLDSLSNEQVTHLGMLLAAFKSCLWKMTAKRQDVKIQPWIPKKGHPAVQTYGPGDHEFDESGTGWHTHPSMEKWPDGKVAFVFETYKLTPEAMRELLELADSGWNVKVESRFSTFMPGMTLKISITKKESATAMPVNSSNSPTQGERQEGSG